VATLKARNVERELRRLSDAIEAIGRRLDEVDRRFQVAQIEDDGFRRLVTGQWLLLSGDVDAIRQGAFNIRRSLASRDIRKGEEVDVPEAEALTDDPVFWEAIYTEIESQLRGSPEVVAELQRRYLGLIAEVESDLPVVDLGCGRGEFLSLLEEEGIDAVGVDANGTFVASCRDQGFVVEHEDLLQYLEAQPDRSHRAVVLFQVLEHLPFAVLLKTIAEAHRILIPGGVFLGETPNGASLVVGGSTFWLDHTHVQPLHPALLKVLADYFGFERVRVDLFNPPEVPWRLEAEQGGTPVTDAVHGLQGYVLNGQDALLVAYRPAAG
jgi:O-antigen chain-terminating methyltransferase